VQTRSLEIQVGVDVAILRQNFFFLTEFLLLQETSGEILTLKAFN
jgi:hypothetical protein